VLRREQDREPPTSLWRELRRRKVVRVFLAYGATTLVLIEGANNVFPALGIPESVNQLLVWLLLGGLPIAVFLAWRFDVVPDPGGDSVEESATRLVDLPADRIAVLPFRDMSEGASDGYFADGVTEDIIAKLSTLSTFNVVSRTSVMGFRGSQASAVQIGQQLGAGSIVEGSVRRASDRVRVVTQLIDVNADRSVWTETYDRDLDDLLSLQSDIATSVARGLRASLTSDEEARLTAGSDVDPEAHDLYLRARHSWNSRSVVGLRESRTLLERALEIDPDYAPAHAAMATSLATSGLYNLHPPNDTMEPALESAQRALALDPRLVEALNARGLVECVWRWDWEAGERTFQSAISASPSDVVARQWYALNCLAPQGRLEEAAASLEVARSLDPLSSIVQVSGAFLAYLDRDMDRAGELLRPVLAEPSPPPVAHLFQGFVHEFEGRHEDARRSFRKARAVGGAMVEALASLAANRAFCGNEVEAREMLEELQVTGSRSYVPPGLIGRVHAALGDWDQARASWQGAVALRSADLMWVGVSPMYDFARERDEWREVVDAVGAYGRAGDRPTRPS
jgi:TolB-like protein/Tfp pilus assembly protein PilF